ncbi:hypothetical protein J4E80_005313 [Alternaria sp. BMP 0032]|nr:hypothetical protein J4E80_005313 [Alternaria sp. BMP 0032]
MPPAASATESAAEQVLVVEEVDVQAGLNEAHATRRRSGPNRLATVEDEGDEAAVEENGAEESDEGTDEHTDNKSDRETDKDKDKEEQSFGDDGFTEVVDKKKLKREENKKSAAWEKIAAKEAATKTDLLWSSPGDKFTEATLLPRYKNMAVLSPYRVQRETQMRAALTVFSKDFKTLDTSELPAETVSMLAKQTFRGQLSEEGIG